MNIKTYSSKLDQLIFENNTVNRFYLFFIHKRFPNKMIRLILVDISKVCFVTKLPYLTLKFKYYYDVKLNNILFFLSVSN